MSSTLPALDQHFPVIDDMPRIRDLLNQIRAAHTEVSVSDFVENDEPPVETERRRCSRSRLQLPVILFPVEWSSADEDEVVICGHEQVGVTRDLSPMGMGVTHDQLIGSEAALVQFDLPGTGPLNFILDLRWSVRKSRYSFTSGGRIVGLVELD